MPLHDFECECGNRKEEQVANVEAEIFCEKCGKRMKVVYDWGTMGIDIFQPFVDTNMGDTPLKVESRQQWARECAKRGLFSHALEGGYKSYNAKREV